MLFHLYMPIVFYSIYLQGANVLYISMLPGVTSENIPLNVLLHSTLYNAFFNFG